jgi:selenocysteine-specific elongation factor
VHVNVGLQTITGKIFPYIDLKEKKVIKEKVDPGTVCRALIQLEKPVPVEVGEKALLMKLDLPPKQFRVIGLAEVADLLETAPEMYSAKVKVGYVGKKTSEDQWIVSGLFQTKMAAQQMTGESVLTISKVKGTIISPHGEKGDVLVKFENPPSASEKVYYYKLRRAKIV